MRGVASIIPKGCLTPAGRIWIRILLVGIFVLLFSNTLPAATTNYTVRGIVREISRSENQLTITHEAIPGLMDSMTMPFHVKDEAIPEDLAEGAAIEFQFHMNESESWINGIKKIALTPLDTNAVAFVRPTNPTPKNLSDITASSQSQASLYHFKFTNELGQPVSLSDFHGQAVALTFFFTRCPVVDYCPRLSHNFQAAQRELLSMKDAPTNWHLISISFDTLHDNSGTLKAYAEAYGYDPVHWTFLTGPSNKISELADRCNVQFTAADGYFNHNFRTMIIDASNHLQMVFPTSGDLSKAIVQQLLKAAYPTGADSKLDVKN